MKLRSVELNVNSMNKKLILASIIILLVWQCSLTQNQNSAGPVYILDASHIMKKDMDENTTSYRTTIPVYTSWDDSITFEISRKGYFLFHFGNDKDGYKRDTSFSKPISFLDSIGYYDSEWLKKEENLDRFWHDVFYQTGGREDTLEIYLIRQIPGTDSIQLQQVHRFFMPNREG